MNETAGQTVCLTLTNLECESLHYGQFLRVQIRSKIKERGPEFQTIRWTLAELGELRDSIDQFLPSAKGPHAGRYRAIRLKIDKCRWRYRAHVERLAAADGPVRVTGIAFQFAVRLLGIDPPIWRRLLVLDGDLREFHRILMAAMGWTADIEPHAFEFEGRRYGPKERRYAGESDWLDETGVLLSDLFPRPAGDAPPGPGLYVYDLTADWQHELLFERHRDWDFAVDYPACLAGERAGPPDGTRGVEGYRRFLAGDSPNRDRILASVPPRLRPFHPEAFNLKKTAAMLKEIQQPPAWLIES